jgi:hypothetical protein
MWGPNPTRILRGYNTKLGCVIISEDQIDFLQRVCLGTASWAKRRHTPRLKSGAETPNVVASSSAGRDFRPTGPVRRFAVCRFADTPTRPHAIAPIPQHVYSLVNRAIVHFLTGGRPGLDPEICRECGFGSHGQG